VLPDIFWPDLGPQASLQVCWLDCHSYCRFSTKTGPCRYCGWIVCGECTEGPKVEVDRWVSSTAGHVLKTLPNGETKPKIVCKSCRPHVHQEIQQRRHNEGAIRARLIQRVRVSLPEYEVAEIKWLHNSRLETLYDSFRQELRKLNRPKEHLRELELFHWSLSIPQICAGGFDPRFARPGEYGEGSYFAEHAIYPLAYSSSAGRPEDGHPWIVPTDPGREIELLWVLCTLGNCKNFDARCISQRGVGPGLERYWPAEEIELNSGVERRRRCPPPLDRAAGREAGTYDSVLGTEGDLQWTDSPRLMRHGREYGRQYVTFDRRQALPVLKVRLRCEVNK
jgi:hypothetical protein